MIYVDSFEPTNIQQAIQPVVPTRRIDLNRNGMADYLFIDRNGRTVQFERKQWGEVLGSIEQVEEQLRREFLHKMVDELNLILEGTALATKYGMDALSDFTKPKQGNRYYAKSYSYKTTYSRVSSWLWQLDKTGITVHYTPNYLGTAQFLCSAYKNSQKEEHTTLRRYIKPRIHIKGLDKQVLTLMGIEGANIGEQRALDLIARFGTAWEVMIAERHELTEIAGIGDGLVDRLWKSVGRYR